VSKLKYLLAALLLCAAPVWAGTGSRDGVAANNDYVEIADNSDHSALSAFTIAAWVNMDDASKFRFLSKRETTGFHKEWLFTTDSSDRLYCAWLDQNASCTTGASGDERRYNTAITAQEGNWIFVACTWDGGFSAATAIDIFLDGVQVDDTTVNDTGTTAPLDCDAGVTMYTLDVAPDGTEGDGQMAYVHLYNRDLSLAELETIRWCPGTIVNGLVGFWPLINEGTGATDIKDHSGLGHDSVTNLVDTSSDGPPVSYPCGGNN
jgi:hypothetical protein